MTRDEKQKTRYASRKISRQEKKKGIVHVCSQCGASSPEKHHEDYSKPMEIIWLCKTCHTKHHAMLGWGVGGRPKIYNFGNIPIGSHALIPDVAVLKISTLVHYFKTAFGGEFKCFTMGTGVVVFRTK